MKNETALITGASSGIGRALAHVFAASGSRVLLTARREGQLAELASELRDAYRVETHVLPEDLADADGPRRLVEAIEAKGFDVNVLVNNAGFGLHGRFDKLPLDRQLSMLRLNVGALTELTWRLLTPMRRVDYGRVLNVASTAAFFAGPNMAVYYATKAYVLSLSEALREELRDTGITITCLCPGPTDTGFADRAGVAGLPLFRSAMPAEAVAQAGYQALYAGRAVVTPGWRNRLITLLPRVLPRRWTRRATASIQPLPEQPTNRPGSPGVGASKQARE
ncbi:MAG: SDR family oxidoreductase [Planctomycetota bacterium]